MSLVSSLRQNIRLDQYRGLKILFSKNLVIHCHHYNSRIQGTIENFRGIDGKKIFRDSAAQVFFELLSEAVRTLHAGGECEKTDQSEKYKIASELYSFLGFGILDFSEINSSGFVAQNVSHFVEGWRCGNLKKDGCVCTWTEGYIQAAMQVAENRSCVIKESQCLNKIGTKFCRFEVGEDCQPIAVSGKKNFQI